MPRYRVTLRYTSVEVVDASNPYQAAVVASSRHRNGVEVERVASAVGRPLGTSTASRGTAKKSKKAAKKVMKKRRPMSPEARAKLAKNLVKARAARARNLKAGKKSLKKANTKRTAKKSPGMSR